MAIGLVVQEIQQSRRDKSQLRACRIIAEKNERTHEKQNVDTYSGYDISYTYGYDKALWRVVDILDSLILLQLPL